MQAFLVSGRKKNITTEARRTRRGVNLQDEQDLGLPVNLVNLVGNIVNECFAGKMPAVLFLTTKHTKNLKQQNCSGISKNIGQD